MPTYEHIKIADDNTFPGRGGVALDARYGDQFAHTATLHVDYVNGSDSNSGLSWKKAKKTIQAAVDSSVRGGQILLAPGRHVVGTGVTCDDNSKTLTIKGAVPNPGRQHSATSFGGVHIASGLTDAARPTSLIRVGTATSNNIYGWTFENMYFDADSLLPDGAFLELHGVNRALFKDISGRVLGTAENMTRWLLKSDGGAGDDASWYHFNNISTYGVKFAHSRQGNYWSFDGVSIMGNTATPRAEGPALDISGSQHNLNGLHIEGWNTGILANNTRGLLGHGIMSEWVGTLVHLVDCKDSIIAVNSSAGAGASKVVDENGKGNIVIGAEHEKIGGTSEALSISTYGMGPTQLSAGFASPIYGNHPVRPNPGIEMIPDGMTDVMGSSTPEVRYWNGTNWATWSGIEPTVLVTNNDQHLPIDFTHKRVKIISGNQYGWAQGLAYLRITQSTGTSTPVTFRTLASDKATTVQEFTVTLDEIAQKRGAWASFQTSFSASYLEVEIDFGISTGQTAKIHRLSLFARDVHPNVRGRRMRGSRSPLGIIEGTAGDIYECVGTSITNADRGFWIYDGASGTGGWEQMMRSTLTSPDGTKFKLSITNEGAITATSI